MNIYHFTSNLSGGGAETQMLLLANSLSSEFNQYVIYKKVESSFPFENHRHIKFINVSQFLKEKKNMDEKENIYHVWIPDVFTHISPYFFYKNRKRVIIGVRNRYNLNSIKRIYQFFCFFLFKNFASNTPKILHSNIYRKAFSGNFSFIPNAVKYEVADTILKKNNDFLYVGRLEKHKGIVELINSMRNVAGNNRLTIIGKGSLSKFIQENSEANSKFLYKGFVQEPLDYFKINKFFVLPSHYEGMPNVAFEAVSQNCILILSDIPQNRQWFNDKQAIFFRSKDVNDLTLKLEKAIRLKDIQISEIIENAKAALTSLTINSYKKSYKNLYLNLYDKAK